MLLGTMGAGLLRNILAGKGINRAGEEVIAKKKSRGIVLQLVGYGNKKGRKATTKRQRHKNKMDFYCRLIL